MQLRHDERMPEPGHIRVIIADADAAASHALASLLVPETDIEVQCVADTLAETLDAASANPGAVILLDPGLAPTHSLRDIVARVRRACATGHLILMLIHESDASLAAEAGSTAWLLKDTSRAELLRSLRAIAGA